MRKYELGLSDDVIVTNDAGCVTINGNHIKDLQQAEHVISNLVTSVFDLKARLEEGK